MNQLTTAINHTATWLGRQFGLRHLRIVAAAFVSGLIVSAPVWADDTEIFFGDVSANAAAPNLLLIVDTSGSMGSRVGNTGKTRMENVQEGLHLLLNSLNNVNVGLMRFSNPGGPVLYQIENLDKNINEVVLVDVTSRTRRSDDDAQEVLSSGDMIIDGDKLSIVQTTVGVADTFTRRIQTDDDDVEEEVYDNYDMNFDSDGLEVTHNNGRSSDVQNVGLRFTNLRIPPGATITDAFIRFNIDSAGVGGRAEMRIFGEVGDARPFRDENRHLSNRNFSSARVRWNLTESARDQRISTPSLTTVVQEIVDNPNWKGDGTLISDMVFKIERRPDSTSVGHHELQAYDADDYEPRLTVSYYVGSPPEQADTLTGLRFSQVDVPKNAKITGATIDFRVAQTDATEETNMRIRGELSPDAKPFSDAEKISTRDLTTEAVEWANVPVWTETDQRRSTPDLTAVIQEMVNQEDWCGGNAMGFVIAGEGLRHAWARDEGNGLQPRLRVQYDKASIVAGQSCARTTLSKQITNNLDDVEEEDDEVWTSSDDLDFQSTSRRIGVRFPGLNIPPGARVLEAFLEFHAEEDSGDGNTTIRIEVENSDDSNRFDGGDGTIDGRSWGDSLDWSFSNDWDNNDAYRSRDIAPLVQSVVNRGGWRTGNAMAFRLRKQSGKTVRALPYNEDQVRAPRLIVTFIDNGTAISEVRLVRDEILEQVDTLNTSGMTPVQDTLFEAAQYFTGKEVVWGRKRGGPSHSGPHAYTRVSTNLSMEPGTFTNFYPDGCSPSNLGDNDCRNERLDNGGGGAPRYKTPINDWCQKENHIIMLTDGFANAPNSENRIKGFIGNNNCGGDVNNSERCVKELANYMFTQDMSPLREKQIIKTHTIGFNFSSQWLKDVAEAGGGQYKEATQAADLVEEIQDILTDVLRTNSTFVAPVAAINQFNRLNHRSEIYFAVFRPDDRPSWPGNLKKYRLGADDNTVVDFSSDAGLPAINADTGFFTDTAVSAWGNVADGPQVDMSGANSQIPAFENRRIYTYTSSSTTRELSNPSNVLSPTSSTITKGMFNMGGASDEAFREHIEWVMGKDVEDADDDEITNENRYIIGDPLHSKPIAVTYGGSETEPDITVFFGSNSGFMHAVNSATGEEQFAFMPEATMDIQQDLRANLPQQSHIYGIDGSVTPWVNDANGDGAISGPGEWVRIFFGMRRGGRNYYALDVTDRDNPRLMWQISGGQGPFNELGMSWSQPVLGNINVNGTNRDVLYFTGGYDPQQDDTDIRAEDTVGRAIFIVDANTGQLIWSGGPGDQFVNRYDAMKYSFPADLSVVDITSSGQDNMFFVGDVGGQLWRFDINNGADVDNLITGGIIADLGVSDGTNEARSNRRFFHGPDVALVFEGGETQLAVSIGSGYQASPLSFATDDRFYMILQEDVFSLPSSYTKLTHSDLYDATANDVGEGVAGAVELLENSKGWYFNMPNRGEKVLSTPLTFKNSVTFTSYEPNPASSTSRCVPAAGITRVYQVALDDASPINNWDDIEGLTEADRGTELRSSSIIDEPVIVCTGAGCDMFVGAEKPPVQTPATDRVIKTFWRKN
ncbi:MAG: PilC/PilY family type IV pilus protein [Pseudomonadota bacterium]